MPSLRHENIGRAAFLGGLLVGWLVFALLGGKCTGCVPSAGNLILQTEAAAGRHLHHWVLFLFLIALVLLVVWVAEGEFNPYVKALLGFATGAMLTGFRYTDWRHFHKVRVTPARDSSIVYTPNRLAGKR